MHDTETAARPPIAAAAADSLPSPRIYHLSPLRAGRLDAWGPHLARAAALGFSHLLIAPPFKARDLYSVQDFDRPHTALDAGEDALAALRAIAGACAAHGLAPLLDVMPDYLAADGATAAAQPDLFRMPDPARALDPRSYAPQGDIALARFDDAAEALAAWWAERLLAWHQAGMTGFRLASLGAMRPPALQSLAGHLRGAGADATLLGWTCLLPPERVASLAGCGLDFVFSSLPWWDFRADWFWAERERLGRVARVIAPVEVPFGKRLAARVKDPARRGAAARRAAHFAVAFGDGWLMPMGFECAARDALNARRDSEADMMALPALAEAIAAANATRLPRTQMHRISAPGADIVAFLRRDPEHPDAAAALVVANVCLDRAAPLAIGPRLGELRANALPLHLAAGEVCRVALRSSAPITLARPALARSAEAASRAPRIAIEAVAPSVDGGRFAAKRLVGETLRVTADVVCDGHDQLAAVLLWRSADETAWREVRMRPLGNDRWAGEFELTRVGRWLFAIEAWRDAFATFRDELGKKHAAGLDVRLELREGAQMVAAAAARAPSLGEVAAGIARADAAGQVALLLAAPTASLMAEADQRPFAVRLSPPCPVDADRPRAAFAAWYELFPRSMSDDPARYGTFADVIRHLPRVAAMGFDVLYVPPIHPIGRTNRKGRNNALRAAPGDPGSPYAIGDAAGGHDAIAAELGTLDDFRRLREAAASQGIELALDFAVQCSPDHPWLKQHPDWFSWRPDGSLKFAENPPKRYEDIVNVDLCAPAAMPDLWVALCEVVLFWAAEGVRIFRVDNPHTKPLPFWEWLIAEVRAAYPDAIFLAEAFTRPKVMQRLAKLGFTQSYTYFTWRNTRQELQEYLTELTAPPLADFFRPNFFVNTPDINPIFLQTSGRAGFLIRAALAATLAGLWGMYCGFELCEATPLPGREEYADSEKYQLRAWDWDRPGHIVAEIADLNRIRRANPALQTQLGVSFLPCDDDHVLAYMKATADRSNVVVVAVSLDPHGRRSAQMELPLWQWGLPDDGALTAEDLLRGTTSSWRGKWQRGELSPEAPYAIWRVSPAP